MHDVEATRHDGEHFEDEDDNEGAPAGKGWHLLKFRSLGVEEFKS